MGKFNFLDIFKIDDDYDDEYDDDLDDMEEERPPRRKPAPSKYDDDDDDEPMSRPRPFRSKSKVVPMNAANRGMMEVNVIKPTSFEDSQDICNTLLESKPVVVNLEGFDPDDAQRIMDFITGCIYAINGKFHQISKYIFIFSPENVDISGDSLSFTGEGFAKVPTINREF